MIRVLIKIFIEASHLFFVILSLLPLGMYAIYQMQMIFDPIAVITIIFACWVETKMIK